MDFPPLGDRKGTTKKYCDKDVAELLGVLSGAICLKTLVLLGDALELFRKLFWRCSRDLFGFVGPFWPLIL